MLFLFFVIFQSLAFSQQIHLDVEKYQLSNGLTVLLYEDHNTPAFTYHQWIRVGSAYEQPGRTGLAHFFEHLMFKGTTKHPDGDFQNIIRSRGGDFNAETTVDYTAFYTSLPAGKLETIVELEADRLRNLKFDLGPINQEREVVKEERRMRFDDEVSGILQDALFKTVFKIHPYGGTTIGSMKDLNAATIEDFKTFYNTYYVPSNAVITIVGDFKKSDAKILIDKYYSAIPRGVVPAIVIKPEPEQKSPRNVTISRQVQNATFAMVYPAAKAGESDAYAMDLLSGILGEGPSSRLYRKMVYEKQIAANVQASSWTPQFAGLFEVNVALKPGGSPQGAAQSVAAEIRKLREQPVSELELEKAKNQVMNDYVNSLKTNNGKARAFEINEMLRGDYRELFADLERYKAITAEQIQSVAKKYLLPQRQSLVQVVPQGKQE